MTAGGQGDRGVLRCSDRQRRSAGTLCLRSKRCPVNSTLPRTVRWSDSAVWQLTPAAGKRGFLAVASEANKRLGLGDGDFEERRRNKPFERIGSARRPRPLNASVMQQSAFRRGVL